MSNLLKDAIADARAVRETALSNAKAVMLEQFKPKLEKVFSEKLKEELAQESLNHTSAIGGAAGTSHAPSKSLVTPKSGHQEFPVVYENDELDADNSDDFGKVAANAEKGTPEDYNVSVEELDEILAELEKESDPSAQSQVPPAPVDPSQAPVQPEAPVAPVVAPTDVPVPPVDPSAQAPAPQEPAVDEEIDLEELLTSLDELKEPNTESDKEEEATKDKVDAAIDEVSTLKANLAEAIKCVKIQKGIINEINLLNAKLLYTSKLFKKHNLNESQKLNIVDQFDKAKTVRETELTYNILAESYNSGASTVKKQNTVVKSITEGLASKAVGSTKPVLNESAIVKNVDAFATRLQHLAGIKMAKK